MTTTAARVARLRVLFGHQSVGGHIVDGVRALMSTGEPAARAWPVAEASAIPDQTGGFLAFCRLGRNGDPQSKTRQFGELVAGPAGLHLDVAMHKYCYADVDAATDVHELFAHYKHAMRALAAARPGVTLAPVTVPLVRVRTGARACAHRLLGRTSPRLSDNANREAFNDLLRREYQGSEPLFELADLESRAPLALATRGNRPRALRHEYTDDGGHSNDVGRRYAAERWMAFLAAIPAVKTSELFS